MYVFHHKESLVGQKNLEQQQVPGAKIFSCATMVHVPQVRLP